MSYDYEVKQLTEAPFEWVVVERTKPYSTKEMTSSNSQIIGMFSEKTLAYEYLEKRQKRSNRL